MKGNETGKSDVPHTINLNPPHVDSLTPMEPIRLFDNFYYVGTQSVGVFIVDTKDGLIMIDSGWGEKDCSQFVKDMKTLGLNPSNIKLILLTHEHGDHYGGVPYLKKNVCPDAKVGMSTIGWNFLHTRPPGPGLFGLEKPQSIDILLSDRQKITLGNTVIQVVATPGHSQGCVSFIVPIADNGIPHMVGVIGGGAPRSTQDQGYHFKASIEYFQQFTRKAKCDVGLSVHFWGHDADSAALRARKPGDPNPFVIGTEKFESVYLQEYKDKCLAAIKRMPPEVPLPPPSFLTQSKVNKSNGKPVATQYTLIKQTPMEPSRLFDNFYYVGTTYVGSFVVDTKDGLIMIDSGWGEQDCSQFVKDMKTLGLNPSNIKLILITHEHRDHYGGVPYLKKHVCPDAKVAMSTMGWNFLQTRPAEPGFDSDPITQPNDTFLPDGLIYSNRPQSIDILLSDGQKITVGNTVIQVVATPGHTQGCISFIVPVTDNGTPHMIGIMGGGGLYSDWEKAYLYKASVEYFQQFTREAKCDVGLSVHFWGHDADLAALRTRKPGEANPFVIGTEKFESVYLQYFRNRFQDATKQIPPEGIHPLPPFLK